MQVYLCIVKVIQLKIKKYTFFTTLTRTTFTWNLRKTGNSDTGLLMYTVYNYVHLSYTKSLVTNTFVKYIIYASRGVLSPKGKYFQAYGIRLWAVILDGIAYAIIISAISREIQISKQL